MSCIYLDHNATTPVDPRVLESMLPYLRGEFGNASSKVHPYGWAANEAVEKARSQVASLLGASTREIIFTSGATEADNMALLGVVEAEPARSKHVITQSTEHPAVLDPLAFLATRGHRVTYLTPDRHGRVTADQVREAIRDDTVLVSIMAANNEIGTLQPVTEIGDVCREAGVVFHTDAAQAVGKIPIQVKTLGVDLLSLSGHKFYAPKGVGALCLRTRSPRIRLAPVMHGGGQERGLRPGTLNVPGIVGLGEASKIAAECLLEEATRLRTFRERLRSSLGQRVERIYFNGHPEETLPGTLSVSFDGVDGSALLVSLGGLAVSAGSACSSSSAKASHVLRTIGVTERLALATLRFALGRFTTVEEVDVAVETVAQAVARLREQGAPHAGA